MTFFLESLTIYNNENPILSACISGFYFMKRHQKGSNPIDFIIGNVSNIQTFFHSIIDKKIIEEKDIL